MVLNGFLFGFELDVLRAFLCNLDCLHLQNKFNLTTLDL